MVFRPSFVNVILGYINTPPAIYAISLMVDGQKDQMIYLLFFFFFNYNATFQIWGTKIKFEQNFKDNKYILEG